MPIAFRFFCQISSISRSRVVGVDAIVSSQRLAVGHVAPAVAVAIDVAELVEQRLRPGGIERRRDVQRVVVTGTLGGIGCVAGSAWPW